MRLAEESRVQEQADPPPLLVEATQDAARQADEWLARQEGALPSSRGEGTLPPTSGHRGQSAP